MDSIGIRIGLLVSAEDLAMPSMNVDLMGVATFEIITLDTLPMVWGY